MKKVAPQSKALYYYIVALCVLAAIFFRSCGGHTHSRNNALGGMNIVYNSDLIGRFNLRSSLEQHYNSAEPMGLALSGVMTFFFGDIYFQYHFNEIIRRKAAARLGPLSA